MTSIFVALIAASGGALTAVVTHLLARKKIAEVHVLVNARLQAALDQVAILEGIERKREGEAQDGKPS